LKLLVAATVLAGFLVGPAYTQQPQPAPVQTRLIVNVSNGTAGGSDVTDDIVVLDLIHHDQVITTLEAVVDTNGQAVFEKVYAGHNFVAIARTRHNDMMFHGHPVELIPGPQINTTLEVYDTSDDTSKLTVLIHHFIVKASGDQLTIREFMMIRNPSDTAILSKERDSQDRPIVLKILLPRGYKNLTPLEYLEQQAIVETEDGFHDTMAIPPGEYKIHFAYNLDITSAQMQISKKISLPTSRFMLFTELAQAKLTGLGTPNYMTQQDGTRTRYYTRRNLKPADEIAFQLTGFNVSKSHYSTWVILTVTFGAVFVLAICRLISKKP